MEVLDLGTIAYQEAWKMQKELVHDVVQKQKNETLILCSHFPVVTLGKKSKSENLQSWQGEIIEVERGGQATYHGPGQIIAYPIINLSTRNNDIHLYLRLLEQAMVETCLYFHINASGNPDKTPSTTGVWVGPYKLGSIGVALKRWVTYHGLALNVLKDPLAFQGINPCGYSTAIMKCMAYYKPDINYTQVKEVLLNKLQELLT